MKLEISGYVEEMLRDSKYPESNLFKKVILSKKCTNLLNWFLSTKSPFKFVFSCEFKMVILY